MSSPVSWNRPAHEEALLQVPDNLVLTKNITYKILFYFTDLLVSFSYQGMHRLYWVCGVTCLEALGGSVGGRGTSRIGGKPDAQNSHTGVLKRNLKQLHSYWHVIYIKSISLGKPDEGMLS
jgi:hypothetical protein